MPESLQENCRQIFYPGNELFSPLYHFHLDSLFFFIHNDTHTIARRKKKNPNNWQTPSSLTREAGKGKRLGRTPFMVACPNPGFSALEGHGDLVQFIDKKAGTSVSELVTDRGEIWGPDPVL